MKRHKFCFIKKKFLNLNKHQKFRRKKSNRVLSYYLKKYKNYKQNLKALNKQKIIFKKNYKLMNLLLLNFKII